MIGTPVQHHVVVVPTQFKESVSLQLVSVRETEQKQKLAICKNVQVTDTVKVKLKKLFWSAFERSLIESLRESSRENLRESLREIFKRHPILGVFKMLSI